MPEITSVEAIRAKLREFEARVDGAMTAVDILARIRGDAEHILTKSKSTLAESAQALQKADSSRQQLQELQRDWDGLKSEVQKSQAESKDTRDFLVAELGSAIQSIDAKLAEAEERFKTTGKSSLAEQAKSFQTLLQQMQGDWDGLKSEVQKSQAESKDTRGFLVAELGSAIQSIDAKLTEAKEGLKEANESLLTKQADLLERLAANTGANASAVESNTALVLERADKLNELLGTIRVELQSETRTKLEHAEELIDSHIKASEQQIETNLQSATQALAETASSNEHVLREQMNSFKEEMKRTLSEHQKTSDQHMTDFLNKQGAMVHNLSQQLDSYIRMSKLQTSELAETKAEMDNLKALVSNVQSDLCSKDEMERKLLDELLPVRTFIKRATDFLNNLNPRLQGISQQLDGLKRLSDVQSSKLAETETKLNEHSSDFSAYKDTTTNHLAVLKKEMGTLKAQLAKVQLDLSSQEKRLNQTLSTLSQIPIVGGYFKGP